MYYFRIKKRKNTKQHNEKKLNFKGLQDGKVEKEFETPRFGALPNFVKFDITLKSKEKILNFELDKFITPCDISMIKNKA